MPPLVPEPPTPAFPDYVNLGLILETPVLHQLQPPALLNTVTTSTLMAGPQNGVIHYTYQNQRELVQAVLTAGKTTKTTRYHYTPVDPQEKIDAAERQRVELERDTKQAGDKELRKVLKQRLRDLDARIKELRKAQRQGFRFAKLVRSEYVESTVGLTGALLISGRTSYAYEGDHIVKATSEVITNEKPPKVDEAVKTYTYDDLGRLATAESYGLVTRYTYDPFGRPLASACLYESPDGTFTSEDRATYTYAPPSSEPAMPSNGLFMVNTTARSGPVNPLKPLGSEGPVQGLKGAVGAALAQALPEAAAPVAKGLLQKAGKQVDEKALLERAAQAAGVDSGKATGLADQARKKLPGASVPGVPAAPVLGMPEVPKPPEPKLPEMKQEPDVTTVQGTYVYAQ